MQFDTRILTDEAAKTLVKDVPGEHGWVKPSSMHKYMDAAIILAQRGMPNKDIYALLSSLYSGTAEEFGG